MERYLGLTETFIYDHLVAMRRVRLVVVARRLENTDRFPLPQSVPLHRSPPQRYTAEWAAAALRRLFRGGNPHLEGILERERIDLIHAHFGPTACEVRATARRAKRPLIASFYGYDASVKEVVEAYRERYVRLFEDASLILVEGSAMKRRLEALGCPSSKIRIHRIGIHPSTYRFRERTGPASGPVTLLMCGRMVPKKGYPIALRALDQARRRGARLALRIIGDGPERPVVEETIRGLGLQDAVRLLGSQPREVFLDEMDRADIYVQPSLTASDGDSEGGAPTTLLEAQASGLPILTTRHADIPEIVTEGGSALLSDEGDAGGLAENMAHLASDPSAWPAMGRAGRAHVQFRHDARLLAAALEDLYAGLRATAM